MPIWQLCANLLIPNYLRSNLSYSPLAALEFYVNKYNSQKSDVMSDLALANVEALASGEIDVNTSYGYGLRDCKDSDGNLTGKRCELTHPYDTCNNKLTWGNCR